MKVEGGVSGDAFFIIPHTHWEGAVFKTREEYLEMGLPNILRALQLLKKHPSYRFVLDQVCYVKPFLDRYPQEKAAFRQLVAEGRLAIAGGLLVMPDVNMPGGESFVRQVLYGKGFFRRELGVEVTTGWQLDTFGHHAQMPQLLRQAGYRSFWFFRGVADWSVPAEFLWEGLDGSRIPAFWLPHGYAVAYGSPASLADFCRFMQERFAALAPFARGPERAGPAGADVCEPEEHVPELVEAFNRQPDAPFHLKLAVPAEYEEAVARRPSLPVITGELNPIFQGAYSSRIELKQKTRELERLLTTAEKLGALLCWLGMPTDEEILARSWEPMLFNQAHDLMSGVMTDHVYQDTLGGYDFARHLADEEVGARLRSYSSQITTQGDGVPIVVFNSLGWTRTDVAVAEIGFADDRVMEVSLVDPAGRQVPVQVLAAERYRSGGLLRAEIAFLARDVPALGHAVYRLLTLDSDDRGDGGGPAIQSALSAVVDPSSGKVLLSNEHCQIEIDSASGAITRLIVKPEGWEVLDGPGNVVAREQDHGDLWELYRPLDGGSRIAMKDRHGVPRLGEAVFSNEGAGPPGTVVGGPVMSEFRIARPLGDTGEFSTTIRLYAGLRRIDIRTRLLNHEPFVRYRVLFPTSVQDGESVHEIPFGALRRPEAIEFPAQNWIDYSDGQHGLALLNRGVPGNNVAGGTVMLSLLRSTRIVAYGFGGGYEPGMTSDTGFELGNERTFDYALVPHCGDWRQARVYCDGLEFNHPLIAFAAASHPGVLPPCWGFLEVSHPAVVVSALKPGPDGTAVLRVYEAAGQPAGGVAIRFPAPPLAAEESNLMEDPGPPLDLEGGVLRFELGPFEIKTIRLRG